VPKDEASPSTDVGAALSRAFGALAARAHTVRDMDARLGRAGFAPEAVDGAVTRLQDLGYLNDVAFADGWVATRRANRLHGTMRLRHDLARHGVDAATIDVAIADDGNEEGRATIVATRAVASLAGTDRATATRRLAGQLARRGFPAGVVARVVRATLDGWGIGTPNGDVDPSDNEPNDSR
jgi:regulatory protein